MYIVLWLYSKYSQCFVGIKWLRFYFYPYGLAILSRRKVPVWLNTGIWEGWIYKHSLKTEWSLHPRWWRKLNYWIRTTNKEWDFEMHGWKDVSARGHSLSWSVKLAACKACHFLLSCIREGNGIPLQCSCLENPRDGEAWWAAVYGVAQSQDTTEAT